MASDGWNRVSRQKSCPICQKTDNCTVSTDGGAVWCGRVAEGSTRENRGGQFLHIQRDGWLECDWTPAPAPKRKTSALTVRDFGRLADEGFSHPDAARKRSDLAGDLGVEPTSLARLRVGWDQRERSQGCWTIPERDAAGNVIGVSTRLTSGKKKQIFGSNRGLTYSDDWQSGDGPILLVEGGSDTAALLSLGLAVVGRPSNNAGIDLLAELLRGVCDERKLIVVGENDRKDHDSLKPAVQKRHKTDCECCSVCWPGRFGAIGTADKLSELLCRDVGWCLAPDNAKDAREWLNAMRETAAAE
jgi:hypothetical protein